MGFFLNKIGNEEKNQITFLLNEKNLNFHEINENFRAALMRDRE